ncbi:Dabb family protein [Aureitalea sp. L0-47]|uniref:Dabb family protein n=1 Tax=Aureitalea sp. L0-47 TaxID=2816962 RepID=UPI0022383A15|nr:Dabb family protein [Aureitalea sp. L0-47]MCW5520294.1 Dabb family protein [Aureitalea sp. L0-47]
MRTIFLLAFTFLLISCKQHVSEVVETDETRIEHLVFFSLKDSVSAEEIQSFKELLKTLVEIDGVSEVEVSSRTDVGDSRTLDYDLLMEIEFTSIANLKSYADHPYHLKVRDSLMPVLAAPPATFDMIPD